MPPKINLKNKRFTRLLVLSENGRDIFGTILWKCKCDCGNIVTIRSHSLISKHTRSCGCLNREAQRTHGLSKHKLYSIWKEMISRCYNKKNKRYMDWGGRGITVCKEWRESPIEFIKWAEENDHKKGLQIDRKNNDGIYCPENCRFVTPSKNVSNQRIRKTSKTQEAYISPYKEKYKVQIPIRLTNKNNRYVGTYKSLKEAIKIRDSVMLMGNKVKDIESLKMRKEQKGSLNKRKKK